jgi:hypothetical protein
VSSELNSSVGRACASATRFLGALLACGLCAALTVRAQELPFVGGERSQRAIVDDLRERVPRRIRQVGTTSVTLRLDLGELAAAYKPRTRSHPRGYLAEIAAYRIAVALGMDNVPPVVGRRLPRLLMEQRFERRGDDRWEPIRDEILWDAPGIAPGAAIYWIPAMRPSELHTLAGVSAVTPWLAQSGEVPPERQELARDIATMIAFDYLIANWDRWSGGNVSTDPSGSRLFVRDHNVAFGVPLSEERYERVRGMLERVERFPRGFVGALTRLDDARLRAALAQDPESRDRAILTDDQIASVLGRRRALLSYVGALVALHGEEAVLAWP